MRNTALAAAAALAMVLPAPLAGAQEEGTGVQEVTGSRSGSFLLVSGEAAFVDVPVLVGEDPEGDATVPGVGADVTTMTMSRSNPAGSNITVTFGVADAPPVANGTPQTIYIWPVSVNGVDDQFYLEARNVSAFGPTAANPTFKLIQDSDEGFLDVATLTGSMDGESVSWNLPLFRIGAAGGDIIGQGSAGGGMGTTLAVPGILRFNNNLLGDAAFMESDYEVPQAEVTFGLAPAGTPPELVATPNAASTNASTGGFSGNLNVSDVEPGEYVLVAKACYGSTNCGIASTTVTI